VKARLACLAIAMAVAGSAAATVSEHPDFTENRDRPQRIVLLPVQSTITRGRLTDAQSLIKETEVLEDALTREAAAALQLLGYELDIETTSTEAVASDERLLLIMDEARDRAFESLGDANRDPKGVGRGRFSIGDAAIPLASHARADGLLVLQSQSFIISKGSKALGALFNPLSLATTGTRTDLMGGLFDMRDGQLLAVVAGREVGPVLKKPDEVARQVIASTFSSFPAHGRGKQAKAKLRRAAPRREIVPVPQAGELGEVATLAAFEEIAAEVEAATDVAATSPETDDDSPAMTGEPPPLQQDAVEAPPSVSEQDLLLRLLETPPSVRPEPTLQAVFLGDVGATALGVRNMSPNPLRISINRAALVSMAPGELFEVAVKPGSHRLLVVHAEEERELVRAKVSVLEGRVAITELWPVQ
jgi:hypothetical protein